MAAGGGPPPHGRSRAAHAWSVRSTEEPAVGAVRLAIAEARGGARVPPYRRIDAARRRSEHRTLSTTKTPLSSALAARVLETIDRAAVAGARPADRADAARPVSRAAARSRGDRVDWSRVRTFNLDEFAGLGASHPNSYRAFMQAELFDHVSIDPANIGFLNGARAGSEGGVPPL